MDSLKNFAMRNNLKVKSSATGEYFISGHEGRIWLINGEFGVELYDQTCLPRKAPKGFIRIVTFNPDDTDESNLACQIIETPGQEELTFQERKEKVKFLTRLRKTEILRVFAQKNDLKLQSPTRNFILGRAGRICLMDGHLGVEVTNQACVQNHPVCEDLRVIPIFNPEDELQARLALEVIETAGQKELNEEERKTKMDLLIQLRTEEPAEDEL